MRELAVRHGLDPELAYWAGYGHDLARELSREELLREAERLRILVDDRERQHPILLHGPVAAAWMAEGRVGGEAAWEAIRFHTTAAPGLSALGKALFVADGVEPGREYPGRAELELLSYEDLDRGYGRLLAETLQYLAKKGLEPHPRMVQAWAESQKRA